jgi:hypothetical protein
MQQCLFHVYTMRPQQPATNSISGICRCDTRWHACYILIRKLVCEPAPWTWYPGPWCRVRVFVRSSALLRKAVCGWKARISGESMGAMVPYRHGQWRCLSGQSGKGSSESTQISHNAHMRTPPEILIHILLVGYHPCPLLKHITIDVRRAKLYL